MGDSSTGSRSRKVVRYFLDTEFIEGFRRRYFGLFGKKYHFLDLISIGLVSGDGKREYYAISKDFDPADADEWVKKNVLTLLVDEFVRIHFADDIGAAIDFELGYSLENKVLYVQEKIGKTRKQIAGDLREYVYGPALAEFGDEAWSSDQCVDAYLDENEIRFFTYYGARDWILFYSLFGTLANMPGGLPKWHIDLHQVLIEKHINESALKAFKTPQSNKHHALSDAHWNLKLFKEIRYSPSFDRRLSL